MEAASVIPKDAIVPRQTFSKHKSTQTSQSKLAERIQVERQAEIRSAIDVATQTPYDENAILWDRIVQAENSVQPYSVRMLHYYLNRGLNIK